MAYSVGLQNVGSYQVSGRPWVKTLTVSSGTQAIIELPNVSKGIRIKKQSTSGTAYLGFRDMFMQRSRAIDIEPDDWYRTNVGVTHTTFTVSFWMYTGNLTTSQVSVLQCGYANDFLYLNKNGDSLEINQSNTGGTSISASVENFSFDEWHHFTYQYDNSSGIFKIFVDGVAVVNQANSRSNGIRELRFSNVSAGVFDGPYDSISFWNKSLSEQEVIELLNEGNYLDPRSHSALANLLHWWAIEDGVGVGDFIDSNGVDTITTIQDRVGIANLTLNNNGSTDASFVDSKEGWFVQSNSATFNNTISLVGKDVFEFNGKFKKLHIYADGADVQIDILASLTSIPADNMYELTGPGIDE